MIGRVSGKYQQGNPSFYRMKNRNPSKSNIVHQFENNNNNTHYNQQKYVLDSTKTNPVYDPRDNTLSACNHFEIQRYVMFDNLLKNMDRDREGRKKQKIEEHINEIGRMLCDFRPPEQVQAIVTGFKRKLDSTTDYTALYTELDNYRTRLVDRALGRPTWSDNIRTILISFLKKINLLSTFTKSWSMGVIIIYLCNR